ncbi:protein kinase [Lysobacter defluvii IMMIB APB-9 = DSM 18482]|uniref:Protein kinase n=2 Tax=Novilysobacter TaxID=3382699 RepID=A0A0A0M8S4_9GAMM|nr:protein kinase [Lysobacter defluvii IMMIB APB-9 = DSM 18482]
MDVEQLEEWRAADALFDQWLDQAEPDREAWLAAQDMPDAVRRRVQQLIRAHERTGNALDSAAGDLAGRSLGDWTLESELGRGGMAVVYLARREQGMASQRAAVKVLTLAALGAGGRERFQREAGILARLGHPNITRLIDSGVADDGTCWLAMPLVEGERIDQWCQARGLDARAIVQLYLQVCAAVAYAHRNLVIHRDLKPSNVLVDTDGNVHLLDFGIGQFADVPAERTRTQWRALTPGYAAPEQLRGDPPTTAIDVYGLGALLHRLLTGRTPGTTTTGTNTTRPSVLVRSTADAYHRHYAPLKNDLDLVLLKALAEEPERRYESVEAFALDLRRWLDGQPVLAEKPRLVYRARKFVARNKAGVGAAALLVASLAGGVGATLWQADEARHQAELAERQAAMAREEAEKASVRAHRAEAVRDFLGSMMITVRGEDGGLARVTDVIDAAAEGARGEYHGAVQPEPLIAAEVLLLTGIVRYNLGDHDRSLADLQDALALLQPYRDSAAGELSRVHWELVRHAKRQGRLEDMLMHARESVALNDLWDAPPTERTRALLSLGEAYLYSDREEAARIFHSLIAEIEAGELKDTVRHINALNGLSIALSGPEHDPRLRLPIQEERLRIAELIYRPDSGGLAHTLTDVTHTFRALGMLERAEQLARDAVAVADRTLQNPLMFQATTRCNLGLVLQQQGRHEEALEVFEKGSSLLRESGDMHLSNERCWTGLAYSAAVLGRYTQALQATGSSEEILATNGRSGHSDAITSCGLRASVELRRAGPDAARRVLDSCPPTETAESMPSGWMLAKAELLLEEQDPGTAVALLETLRTRHMPEENHREWMRPWMLSVLAAHSAGDTEGLAALESSMSAFSTLEPVSQCLAAPGPSTCLAFP